MRKMATVRKISAVVPIDGAEFIEVAEVNGCVKYPFYYDETSPSHLRWSEDRYSGTKMSKLEVKMGTPAGDLNNEGYYRVIANGKRLLAHRVIYEIFFGEIPTGKFVDHIDGDRINNCINNLRLVDRTGNSRNHKTRSTNKTGFTGVTLRYSHKGTYPMYTAQWRDLDGNVHTKSFSVSKYGESEAFRLACNHRVAAIENLNINGAGYTDRHFKTE